MHLFIVTGSSRGLGASLARQLAQPGHTVIGIARRTDPGLAAEQWSLDLADPLPAAQGVLHRQRVQAERGLQGFEVGGLGRDEVEPHERLAVVQSGAHGARVVVIGPMALDSVEARRMGGADGVGQRVVGPQKAQIGGKASHVSHAI